MAIFKIVLAVRDIAGMEPMPKTVLLHLSTYTAGTDGTRIYPGQGVLIEKTGLSRATLARALTYLQEKGWIEFEDLRIQRIKGYKIVLSKLGMTPEDTKIRPKTKTYAPVASSLPELPPYAQGLVAANTNIDPLLELSDDEMAAEEQRIRQKKERLAARRLRASQQYQIGG